MDPVVILQFLVFFFQGPLLSVMPVLLHLDSGLVLILIKKMMIHVLMCAQIIQHKCEIHSFSTKLAIKILSFKLNNTTGNYLCT
jgi:hypothetical protein